MIRFCFIWITFFLSNLSFAQQYYSFDTTVFISPNTPLNIHFPKPITSFSISTNTSSHHNFFVLTYQDTTQLASDPHSSTTQSDLFIFKNPADFTLIQSEAYVGKIVLHCHYVEPLEIGVNNRIGTNECKEPYSISFDVWREGLPIPKPGRISTEVNHLIIHHSASSNDNINYIGVIRNIYMQHTVTNGWDDIAYNYLIDKEGTLYKGRDPQGMGDQDNIQGAHYCHKNQNTMGVCLLGNFDFAQPTKAALNQLYDLLAWKAIKESWNVYDSVYHGVGSFNPMNTPRITGHKFGCGEGYTNCPGENLYAQMESIRDSVFVRIQKCANVMNSYSVAERNSFNIYPNPSNGLFSIGDVTIKEISVTDLSGNIQKLISTEVNSEFRLQNDKSGVFVVTVQTNYGIFTDILLISK